MADYEILDAGVHDKIKYRDMHCPFCGIGYTCKYIPEKNAYKCPSCLAIFREKNEKQENLAKKVEQEERELLAKLKDKYDS